MENLPQLAHVEGRDAEFVRDDRYYLADGDVVICADNVLYRVHKFLLSRDSSAFQDMFSLPVAKAKGRVVMEGSSDDNPLVLHDQSEKIRALFWILYSLPDEFRIVVLPDGETEPRIEFLLTIAEITNKYHFTTLETWARRSVRKSAKTYPFDKNSSPLLTRLLDLAILCDDKELRNFVTTLWLDLIFKHKIAPMSALSAADRYSLRRFQGLAYYMQLQKMERAMEQTKRPLSDLPDCKELSQEQLLRILGGHWSLSAHSERIFAGIPRFPQGKGCPSGRHALCVEIWEKRWVYNVGFYDATRRSSSAEIMRKVFVVENSLENDQELVKVMSPSCRVEGLYACQRFSQSVADKLWEHFALPISGDNS